MASTYSTNLGIELIGTGDQSGTWGATTNTNLGTLLEQAIVGYSMQAVADSASPTVLAITNGASSTGRNYVITLTGALTANRTVEVPAVNKPYTFFNNTTGGFSVTVKVTGQTGVTIANGKKAIVYTNSTDVIEVVNAPVSEAGTQTLTNKTLTSPTLTAPALGTPASGVLTNATGLPLTTGVTGTLPVANGGTGVTTSTGSGNNVLSTSPTLVTPILGTPTSVTLTNATGLPLTSGVTGTLPVANGGTGVTTSTGTGNVVLSASPTLTGTLTAATISASGSISDSIGNVRTVPENTQTTGYTLVATDNGKYINITTGGVTVPSGVFSSGQSVTIYNNSASSQTITQGGSVTMYQVGTATTGNRTLAQRGLCTVFCVASNTFVITGGGLT